MRFFSGSIFILILSVTFSGWVSAGESVGTFNIEDLHIRATASSVNQGESKFDTIGSYFGLKWSIEQKNSAYISVGSQRMRNLPIYYAAANDDRIGLVEAYAQHTDYFGRFRVGLIPIGFGYDGSLPSFDRIFNYSLFYSERVIGLNDQGISFYTEHRGYYTQLAVHNGEVDTTADGRLWTTGLWGFTNDRNFKVQLSLQSGYVEGALSTGATNTLAGVTNGQTARWRNGLFFMNWYPRHWNVVVEFGGGELDQNESEGRYDTTLFEVTRQFTKYFVSGFRYNQFDPNGKIDGDSKTEISLVMALKNVDATSQIILQGTKAVEETNEIANDQIRLVWMLTPIAH